MAQVFMRARFAFLMLLAILLCVPAIAENIFPDPSFDATGVTGTARTGERSGHLKVGSQQHWASLEIKLPVEPFATYKATGYVKAKLKTGTAMALYSYAWNSFDWSFTNPARVQDSSDWTKVETILVSPTDSVFFSPLVLADSSESEAWVDDVTVEKLKSPEETIAAILAKQDKSNEDIQLLSRYYLSKGDIEGARALMASGDDYTRSDTACAIGLYVKDTAKRTDYAVDMVRYGGPARSNGMDRFNELTNGITTSNKLKICLSAVQEGPSRELAERLFRDILNECVAKPDCNITITELSNMVADVDSQVKQLRSEVSPDADYSKEVEALSGDVNAARSELANRKKSLGRCVIKIGGVKLTPETHAIVVPDKPTPQEEYAARDLRMHMEILTGYTFPLVNESKIGRRTPIVVGKCALIKKLGVNIDFASLGIEGIEIKTVGPALILAGNKRGVLYATYTFLEDYLGCRWFTPDCTTVPKSGVFNLKNIAKRYIPPLEYRATDYPNSREANWAVHNKLNGERTELDEERGGKIEYRGFVHTFQELVPPDKYFAAHPEYASEVGGKRTTGYTQLCLTNPEVLKIAIATVKQWIKDNPNATIFSVSQNDTGNFCTCKNCAALAEKEGSESGPLIHFVNAVADAIKDEYPDKIIDTLAYQWSRKPPKYVKPRSNVAVRLCSIECCFSHPLATDPYNASFVSDIKNWHKICNRLHIWDYVIDYAHSIMPFPNLYVLKPNINFFIKNGVTGIYEEANYFSKGGELAELRTYIMAKTLWNPSYDTDKAIDEFCAAYYGAAAQPIREYINLIHAQVRKNPNMHVTIGAPPNQGYLTPAVMSRSVELFDKAEKFVSDDPVLLHRVQVARLPIIYSQISLQNLAYKDQGDKLAVAASSDIPALSATFEKIARAEGVTQISESTHLDAWLSLLPKNGQTLDIVQLHNSKLALSVLPERGGRIYRMRYLPSNKDIMKRYGTDESVQPGEGGYEEYGSENYRSDGWYEGYTVVDRTDTSVTMKTALKSGLELTRKIDLDPNEAKVRITSTLTNPGAKPTFACLRVHPSFEVSSTQKADVLVKSSSDKWIKKALASQKDPLKEKEQWMVGELMPAGEWALVDESDGVKVTDRFDIHQINKTYLNWNGAQQRVNLELYSPTVKLDPGKSLVVSHEYEITDGK